MVEQGSVEQDVRSSANKDSVRFGQIAIRLGYLNRNDLKLALALQKRIRNEKGKAIPLGDILVHKEFLTEEQRQHVYEQQGKLGGHTHIPGFELQEKIGRGAMGTVYKAVQEHMNRTVAIKVLAPRLATKEEYVDRFVEEGKSVARLNHPNIVQGIDAGASNGVHYFVMEYIDGPTVESLIDDQGPLSCDMSLNIIKQITEALQHAYNKDMVHCDVKPENMIQNSDGTTKLCDLGLVSMVSSDEHRNMNLGTPNYLSPEQALDNRQINIQSDIYSLGACLYHMITGAVPFSGEDPEAVVKKHIEASPDVPSEHNNNISAAVDDLVLKMMRTDRKQRHKTPSELKKHINDVQSERGSDFSGPSRRRRHINRRR